MLLLLINDIVYTIFSTFANLFGGVITELPFGMDVAVQTFGSHVLAVVEILPMLDIIWTLFIWAIFIKMCLIILEYSIKIIGIIRG